MARKVPGPVPGSLVEYVPKAFGNDKDAEPVRVFIKAPSQADKREHIIAIVDSAEEQDGKAKLNLKTATEQKKDRLGRFVDRVDGYVDQAGVAIKTGLDLFERGEEEISSEVSLQIQLMLSLSEEAKKNFDASQNSILPGTLHSNGTAPNASPAAKPSSATASSLAATLTSGMSLPAAY